MKTPANSTKQFMNDLINTMNIFFKKISKNQIQFQLSQHYALAKKVQNLSKIKEIKKDSKTKIEENSQKTKNIKKAFKKYRQAMNNRQNIEGLQNLSDKEKAKQIKAMWKKTTESDKLKWLNPEKKKKEVQTKVKQKANETKQNPKQEVKPSQIGNNGQ